jgi:hypothetical protein
VKGKKSVKGVKGAAGEFLSGFFSPPSHREHRDYCFKASLRDIKFKAYALLTSELDVGTSL